MVGRTGPWPPASVMAKLRPAEREALLASGTEREFPHGSLLVLQGELGKDLFVLLDGYVKVVVDTERGTPAILAIRARGDLIGEFAVIDEGVRTASVVAVNAVVAVRISRQRYQEFGTRFPEAKETIFKSVITKMRLATERRMEARIPDTQKRFAKALYELAVAHGVLDEEGVVIPLPLSKFELGNLAGVGESTTERHLKEFRDKGLVRTRYKGIVILELERLRLLWDTE